MCVSSVLGGSGQKKVSQDVGAEHGPLQSICRGSVVLSQDLECVANQYC